MSYASISSEIVAVSAVVLRMGREALGPMCCVTHVKEPSALIEKRMGSPRCSLMWLLYAL